MLKLDNLYKKYGERSILNGISLSLKKGQIALLLGHSGAGKSTLLRVIGGIDKLDSGNIFIDDKLPGHQSRDSLKVGIVFQNFSLFDHWTVMENITRPLKISLNKEEYEAEQIAANLLEKYKLTRLSDHYPAQLSGGQKQRLAIARAVAMDPSLLCFDEPTSALDPKTTNQVADQIKHLSDQNKTILIATHDIALIDKLDCLILLMEEGKIVDSAQSAHFLAFGEKYPAILEYIRGNR